MCEASSLCKVKHYEVPHGYHICMNCGFVGPSSVCLMAMRAGEETTCDNRGVYVEGHDKCEAISDEFLRYVATQRCLKSLGLIK